MGFTVLTGTFQLCLCVRESDTLKLRHVVSISSRQFTADVP